MPQKTEWDRSLPNKVAVIQMVSQANVQSNLDQAYLQLKKASDAGASLVVLPENFATFGTEALDQHKHNRHPKEKVLFEWLSLTAKNLKLWIVGGTMPWTEAHNCKPVARCWVISSSGQAEAHYDKVHLFDAQVSDEHQSYRESNDFAPGSQVVVVDTPFGALGLSVCYDVRFPELYQSLRIKGAELIAIPAAFTLVTGQAHWETLIRARAIETQSFVLAANQGGKHQHGRETYGHSAIIDPWGVVMTKVEKGNATIMASCDLTLLNQTRNAMTVMEHRRFLPPILKNSL